MRAIWSETEKRISLCTLTSLSSQKLWERLCPCHHLLLSVKKAHFPIWHHLHHSTSLSCNSMAATPSHFISTSISISIILLIFSSLMEFLVLSSANPTSPALLLHSLPAMVLPLYLSTPNSSSRTSYNPRRLLQRSESLNRPNARMRLYDDLLRNGYVPQNTLHSSLFIIIIIVILSFSG